MRNIILFILTLIAVSNANDVYEMSFPTGTVIYQDSDGSYKTERDGLSGKKFLLARDRDRPHWAVWCSFSTVRTAKGEMWEEIAPPKDAELTVNDGDMITYIVRYPAATFMVSIFPREGRCVLTVHKTWFGGPGRFSSTISNFYGTFSLK